MVMGKSVERERTRTFSHTLHRQRRVPQAPLWLPYLWYSREKGMQQTSVRAGGLTIQLICFSSNWAGGNPVLSSTPALHLSPKNTYIHIGPGINGGDSLAYQEKPLSKFWKALMFSIQILFYSDFVQHSSQGSRMLGPTTSRRHVDQSRCPAPVLQSLREGNCGLTQYPHSGWADSLSTEWEMKREEVPTGAKTDLTCLPAGG